MVAGSEQSRKLRAHIYKQTQEAERDNMRHGCELSKAHPCDLFPPIRPYLLNLLKLRHQLERKCSDIWILWKTFLIFKLSHKYSFTNVLWIPVFRCLFINSTAYARPCVIPQLSFRGAATLLPSVTSSYVLSALPCSAHLWCTGVLCWSVLAVLAGGKWHHCVFVCISQMTSSAASFFMYLMAVCYCLWRDVCSDTLPSFYCPTSKL